jgi:hypothetical protein
MAQLALSPDVAQVEAVHALKPPTGLADTAALSAMTHGAVKPATIRVWAHLGLITRKGTEGSRALYSVFEFADLAKQRGCLLT